MDIIIDIDDMLNKVFIYRKHKQDTGIRDFQKYIALCNMIDYSKIFEVYEFKDTFKKYISKWLEPLVIRYVGSFFNEEKINNLKTDLIDSIKQKHNIDLDINIKETYRGIVLTLDFLD